MRLSLYRNLINLDKQVNKIIRNRSIPTTGVIETIRSRFREASQEVEEVNTSAIIDGIFRNEQINFFGITMRWEVADRFSRIIPNLLLTLGLLGTFLGITLNLNNISTLLNQIEGDNIDILVNELQEPLEGMGIAFLSSLVAVTCSAFLTLTNLAKNTTALKLQIFSTLEDYLDNVYLPTIPSHSRLDRAVDRMVSQQQDFLYRFHDNVTEAVEASLGKVANKIAEGNKEATDLARQVYERFSETAGTLAHGATQFQYAVESLEKEVTRIQEVGESVSQGATVFTEAANKIENSKFTENLENLTVSLAETQTAFADSTARLQTNIEELTNSNLHATDLAEQLSSNLNTFTDSLSESASQFQGVATTIAESHFDQTILQASEKLQATQTEFTETVRSLEGGLKELESAIAQTENSSQKLNTVSQQLSQLTQNSEKLASLNQEKLNQIQQALYLFVKAIGDNNFIKKTVSGLDNLQQNTQEIVKLNQQAEKNEQSHQESLANLQYNLMKLLTLVDNNKKEDKINSAVEEIRKTTSQLHTQVTEINQHSQKWESFDQTTIDQMQTELSQLIQNIKNSESDT
ncbi:hypothetical protein FRE64_10635 [Euhalothece natronophila Z-M001]|uniref:Uncharacterized protein n=1 Tax=Euhalothece natronophila Z-M001 TaxID=522448 RepID=A0A5B8NQ73_9CHRO|nr:hypothetical protein [Euhalothece natronophila]QDZ40369.1 hypothetical protein FRE64_10635 [Euhalothece natronophila Z-M001]